MQLIYEPISLAMLWPEIILVIGGCATLLASQARSDTIKRGCPWIALWSVVIAATIVSQWIIGGTAAAVGSGLVFDSFAAYVRVSTLILGFLLVLVGWTQPKASERGEFISMLVFSLVGVMLVGAADDLLTLFIALELVSIPTYILVVLSRSRLRAAEAATKYFYLGAMSAAIMAYGFSLLYGVAGTTNLTGASLADGALPSVFARVATALHNPGTYEYWLASIGLLLSFGGLLFKIAAVPLHFYIADVYQGAASTVAGLLGFVPKFAGIVAIVKVLMLAGWEPGPPTGVFWLLWIIAAVSMTVGNVLALRQTNIKRMLGYSGIAHSGYLLVGLIAGPAGAADGGLMGDGVAAVLYYIVVYGIANLAAFAVLALLRVRGRPCETLRDVAGLLRTQPGLALLMALAMLTLMGLPPTPGFWGKLSLFGSALASSETAPDGRSAWIIALVVIAVLNSALAAAYYLRVTAACLLYENDQPARAVTRDTLQVGALICGVILLLFSVWPTLLLQRGRDATRPLRPATTVLAEHAPVARSLAHGITAIPGRD